MLSIIPLRCSLLAIGHLCQHCPFVFEMAHRPGDHPEDFNAFGYDPRGHVANFAGLMFGENWRPDQQRVTWCDGPQVAPPRYGPPADYQHHYLPENFYTSIKCTFINEYKLFWLVMTSNDELVLSTIFLISFYCGASYLLNNQYVHTQRFNNSSECVRVPVDSMTGIL